MITAIASPATRVDTMPRLWSHTFDFPDDLAALVGDWAEHPRDARMWRRCEPGPVPADQVLALAAEPGVRPHTLRVGGAPVGYGELWIDDELAEVELGRLIVAPRLRGHGLGQTLTRGLAGRALLHHRRIVVRVLPDDHRAMQCLRAVGLQRVSAASEDERNAAQPLPYFWFELPTTKVVRRR